MFKHIRRPVLVAAALFLVAGACAAAQSLELERIERSDVKVLPGREGFVHPLTGITYYSPQTWQDRPALAIKIGNSVPERPQAGIDKADLIYEEIVEGGVTRFLAVFSTQDAAHAGPVRSVRTVDPILFGPIGGLFGYSGGIPEVVSNLRAAPKIEDVGAFTRGQYYRRDSSRPMPYNLYTSTADLWNGEDAPPPGPQFAFLGSQEDPTQGSQERAREVKLSFADKGAEIRYEFNGELGSYERYHGETPHIVQITGPADDVHLAFRNVIVQMVKVTRGSTVDQAGLSSSDIQVVGSGAAVVFRGGRAVRGRWERTGAQPTRFVDDAGNAIKLAPGNTIVELVPEGREIFVS